MADPHESLLKSLRALGIAAWILPTAAWPQLMDHAHHGGHRMTMNEGGMVMNHNEDVLPRDCDQVRADHVFEVTAGTAYARDFPGAVFTYDRHEFEVGPCSRVRIIFTNEDEVRHQWMLHGLPRYLYPGGMFHLEAAGGRTVAGSFIVPSDARTYLVHCDITQHMEKGMKGQLKVAGGDGDLWAVPGISDAQRRSGYLPRGPTRWLPAAALVLPLLVAWVIRSRGRR